MKILPFVTQSRQLCQTSRTYRWGNDTLKLTPIVTLQTKVVSITATPSGQKI